MESKVILSSLQSCFNLGMNHRANRECNQEMRKITLTSFLQNLFQLFTLKLFFISKLTWILTSVRQDKKINVPKANFKLWVEGSILLSLADQMWIVNSVFFSVAMICTALILLKPVNNYSYILHLTNLSFFWFLKITKITKNTHNVNILTYFTAKGKQIIQRTCIFYKYCLQETTV